MSSDALNRSDPALHNLNTDTLQPPAGFRDSVGDRTSYGAQSSMTYDSSQPLPNLNKGYQEDTAGSRDSGILLADKEERGGAAATTPPLGANDEEEVAMAYRTDKNNDKKKRPWPLILGVGLLIVAIVVVAVIVPVYFKVIKKNNSSSAAAASPDTAGGKNNGGSGSSGNGGNTTSTGGGGTPTPTTSTVATGGYGSTVTTEDGTTFQYMNTFGGFWVSDPNDPYNNNAQAQSWSPPINQSWQWGVDVVRGVNLGGWLVPEPFIVPALFEPYLNGSTPAKDEWTLSQAMAADTANGGLDQLETHYKTFITEEDFAKIASAGLNWVRLPIPFWAISAFPGEPFLQGTSWKYILKAFAWARKYGIRVNLDLHTMPGSQNGYNHSGKGGQVDWLYGTMGLANAQRSLDYMRIFVEFISQKEFANLVPYFGVVNEPLVKSIGMDVMGSFYLHMHDVLRNVTGIGEGHGPYLSIHDGFEGLGGWSDFLPGSDRMAMDSHPYMCFTNPDPSPISSQHQKPCDSWASSFNTSWSTFGVTTAGEWSLAVNDCGYWVNGVNAGTRWEGTLSTYGGPTGGQGSNGCDTWNNWQTWDQGRKDDLKAIALASMDALQNYFFWTWKIGNSSVLGTVGAPLWSYSLGLENGWMPTDPRAAVGVCGGGSPVTPLKPAMTGGAGAGSFSNSVRAANPWPPTTLAPGGQSGDALPTYTQTGTPIPTLAMPSSSASVTDDGWFNPADTTPMYTPVAGCTYPDAWDAQDASAPSACSGNPKRRVRNVVPMPRRTAAPA
ncbi:hypothetical protein FRB93_001114 [Tulasnella sp. JGI-2019a]|nr:hypothetical protein FRB93_001114 [Tulasnella sp. JGI-2019a]